MDRPGFVAIGKIVRAHGIKGFVSVDDRLTDNPDRFRDLKQVFIEANDEYLKFEVESCLKASRGWLVKFKGVSDRDQAEELAGFYISIESDELPQLDDGVFYDIDLIGIEVVDIESGEILGKLEEIVHYPANAVYRVVGPKGRLALPATHDIVKKVDIDNQKMEVMLLDGIEFEQDGR